jgi:hypothetical protein
MDLSLVLRGSPNASPLPWEALPFSQHLNYLREPMDALRATIEEFGAEGYRHIQCSCPRCGAIRLRPLSWLPKISMGLTLAALSARLRCAECGGPLRSVKPWRQADVLGNPLGRRG